MGVPGVLLVALEGVFSFLGRPRDGFQENPGNSGSHFGSILDDFLVIFRNIFRLRFLSDFLIDLYGFLRNVRRFFCTFFEDILYFLRNRKNVKNSTPCRRELKNEGSEESQMILKCVKNRSKIQYRI